MSTHRDVIIIGGGVAGINTSMIIREYDKESSISVFTKAPFTYTKMALHYIIKRGLSIEFFKLYPDFDTKKIEFYPSTEVKALNLVERSIKFESQGIEKKYTFNKLVLATGAKPIKPGIDGVNKIGVFTFNEYDEALMANNYICVGMKAFVVGAGLVGLLLADALRTRGLDVTLVEKLPGIGLTMFDEEISNYLIQRLVSKGVKVLTNASIDKIMGDRKDKRRVKKVVINGYKFPADMVFFTIGVKPENRLAVSAGIELGSKKAIRTNEKFETSVPNVYSVGDCATSIDYFTKKETFRPIDTLAVSMAEIAGKNCAGVETTYDGFIPMQYLEVFDIAIIRIGLNTKEAKELGLNTSKSIIKYKVPGIGKHPISLLVCLRDRRQTIIGWQAASPWLVSYKSTIFMKAIKEKIGLDEFMDKEKNIELVG
ncbi:MAG: FAD-dependent oxidoreductase [Nitrososphaerota archaeon]